MNLHVLVFLSLFGVQCWSQNIKDEDTEYVRFPIKYIIRETDGGQEIPREDPRILQASRRSGVYQEEYPSEENPQEESNYRSISRQSEQVTRNEKNQFSRPRTSLKKPVVEQYLKEVTPTRKTNERNYPRFNGQAKRNKQQTEESRQSPFQYVLQSDLQQNPTKQQQSPPIKHTAESRGAALNNLAYQNALLAHQRALIAQQQAEESIRESENYEPRSSIYVSQNIAKKQTIRKIPKNKQTQEEDEVDYYARLQQHQQQKQHTERKEPPAVRYQAKLTYPPSPEPENQQYQPVIQYKQVQPQRQVNTQNVKYITIPKQQAQQLVTLHPIQYQIVTDSEDDKYQSSFVVQSTSEDNNPTRFTGGPKYLPEPKPIRYQSVNYEEKPLQYHTDEDNQQKYQPQVLNDDALIRYRAAIAKYQAAEATKEKPQYQTEELKQQPIQYQLQYNTGERDERNAGQEQIVRYIQAGRSPVVIYRQ